MRVCFTGARRLGLDCLRWLTEQPDIEVAAIQVDGEGWWGSDRAEIDAFGILEMHPEDFVNERPDLVISVLSSYLFTADDLSFYPAVNLHPAPLPQYRGCNSYSHALMNGDTAYAVSLHYVEPSIDTGPVIATGRFPIRRDDTARRLYDRAQLVAFDTFKAAMPAVLEAHRDGRRVYAQPQDESRARYYRRDSLADKRTHPDDDARIRALTFDPHPPPEITTDVPVGFGR